MGFIANFLITLYARDLRFWSTLLNRFVVTVFCHRRRSIILFFSSILVAISTKSVFTLVGLRAPVQVVFRESTFSRIRFGHMLTGTSKGTTGDAKYGTEILVGGDKNKEVWEDKIYLFVSRENE